MSQVPPTPTARCPECGGDVVAREDETVCRDCGLVIDADHVDRGPEWRSFEDDRTRTGAPLSRSRHDRGLSTEVGHRGDLVNLPGRKRRRLVRLRRHHARAKVSSKRDRNRRTAFFEIRRLTSVLSLPEHVQDEACSLVRRAQSADLLQGRSLEGFAAAGTYAACRTAGVSRTIEEVVDVARADEGELKVAYDALNRNLGLAIGPIDPREYLPRFANELGLDVPVERRATELAGEALDRGVVAGRNPCGVAAACLYAAAREGDASCTQAEAAAVADVSAATVRDGFYAITGETNG
jgi:transcription initiation factor TFIIB